MLKRNLIAIAIAVFGLVFASNAFGQDREAGSGLATGIKKPTTTVKKPKQVQPRNSGGNISNQRTSRTRKTPTGYVITKDLDLSNPVKNQTSSNQRTSRTRNPQNYAMELGGSGELGVRKRTNKSNSVVASTQKTSSKQPRKRSTQKRQHLPCKQGDCK